VKVLIACEESQTVCKAFRERGHEAYSCDLQPCSGGHPEWHIQDDAMNVLRHELSTTFNCEWDMVIAFPPCTDLSVSGARWFKEKQADGRQQKSIRFFEFFTLLQNNFVAIENPIGIMSSLYRKPDQIIQPYQFGHGETKATCLWLKGLSKLQPTNIVDGREGRVWKMPPSQDRAKLRSKTYSGIAKAMAEQWS
jgi:site-specific DNA-cytosine methylase